MGMHYIVKCGEHLVYCFNKAKFAVLFLGKSNDISFFGCSPEEKTEITQDIQSYLSNQSNMLHLLLSAREFQSEAAPRVPTAAPEQVRIAAPPVTRISNEELDRLLSIRQAEKEAERRAQAEREAAAKLAEEFKRMTEEVNAMKQKEKERELEAKHQEEDAKKALCIQKLQAELEQLKQTQQLSTNAALTQNQMVVRRGDGGRGTDFEKNLLLVAVVLAAVFLLHSSTNAKMDSMAIKTDRDLQIIDHSNEKALSAINYMHESLMQEKLRNAERWRNTEHRNFDERRVSDAKPAENEGFSWQTYAVTILVMVVAFFLYQNYSYYDGNAFSIEDAHL